MTLSDLLQFHEQLQAWAEAHHDDVPATNRLIGAVRREIIWTKNQSTYHLLSHRDQHIFTAYYRDRQGCREIGEAIGVSAEATRRAVQRITLELAATTP